MPLPSRSRRRQPMSASTAGRLVLLCGVLAVLAGCMQQPARPDLTSVEPQMRTEAAAPAPQAGVRVNTPLPEPQADPVPAPEIDSIEVGAGTLERRELPPLRNDMVVILPHADGSAGAIVVTYDEGEVVLNEPYAAALIEGPAKVRTIVRKPEQVRREFAAALAALPKPPMKFIVYFDYNSDQLDTESERQIERVFAELSLRPAPEISVIGHTDTKGSAGFNDRLSLQRAQTVRDELARRGIAPDLMTISGRGERELLVPTEDQVVEPRNRRVEIDVR